VAESRASPAAHVYERATLDAQIMMISRVFDGPGRGHILAQDRLSFPVCRQLLALPGVIDLLLEQSDHAMLRHQAFLDGLLALENEEPNRVQLIRSFRDENIAHELRFDVLPQRPQYNHIQGLIDEASTLVGHLAVAVNGEAIVWSDGDINRSATWLWDAVAEAGRRDE
jgi:hypothetical protein